MFQKIVVPLDGSTFAEQALPWALTIARRATLGIEIVHVNVPLAPLYRESRPGIESARESTQRKQMEAYLTRVVDRILAMNDVPVKQAMLDGPVVEAIHEYTVGHDALVVMTTHGRGPLMRFWMGSVADQLLRRTSVPLLMVNPSSENPAALEQDVELRRILIPLDGTPESEGALKHALELGELMRSEQILLRVVEPMVLVGNDPLGMVVDAPPDFDLERRVAEERTYLDRVAKRMERPNLKVRTRVTTGFHPAMSIVEEAVSLSADLIAMQTHGRRGFSRMLLGSVADKVLRSTSIPLLIHRPS